MSEKKKLSNHEIVTIAVYRLGGKLTPIDTEDVAMEANELAPKTFTWRKYPDQISIANVRYGLEDAKKAKNGAYLSGSGGDGWMLTSQGLAFAKLNSQAFSSGAPSGRRRKTQDEKWLASERERLLASNAFVKSQTGHRDSISRQDIAGVFRFDEYVTGKARERKVNRLANAFLEDPELGPAMAVFLELLKQGEK